MNGEEAVNGANRVHIFDTTLRDGEQSPGISLNTSEKVEIANQLARLGVDVIEAGFPITSPGDFEAVQRIAREVEGPVICGLARAQKGDIDVAWEAVRDSERPRIHTFISTSDIHIEYQMRNTREDVIQGARAAVSQARSLCEDVEFSPMDATRADVEFTAEVCAIAVEEGATVVNIPDTVGYTTPEEYTRYFEDLYRFAPSLRGVELSVHCHDDLGLAVANSYAGVLAGARQVECAVNGIGERAGNCSLEEIAMLIKVRGDVHGLETGIRTRELARTSRLVSRLTGYAVPPNKAVVGRNAFAHESGIHQDGVLKERSTFEIMDATEVGFDSNQIVLGKHSGRHALQDALEQLGFVVQGDALNRAFSRFKEVADRKKQVTALDLEALVSDEMHREGDSYELASFEVSAGSNRESRASVTVSLPEGDTASATAGGDGPVDAIFQAARDATGVESELREYRVAAVTGGEDALGQVTVVLRRDGITASGQGVSTDILEASAQAYVRALSNLVAELRAREESEASPSGEAKGP
ncbi:MAG: 2-isopropylmalate synthase [Solirubrobacterales bacterium]